jgi:hypothetical protein
VEIDLVDKHGVSLDRRVIALDAPQSAAHDWAWQAAGTYARALAPHLEAAAARFRSRERAVADAATGTIASTLVQHGLFERRAERDRAAACDTRRALAAAARDAIHQHDTRARIAGARVRTIATFSSARNAETPRR